MTVPYTFGSATSSIPLSQLDSNFATTITLGNTAIQLGNTVTTLNNMTLANVTVSSGNVTLTNVSATTANVTTANITNSIITTGATLTYGTANGVAYLNTSKVVTATSAFVFDGTNVGIGTSSPASLFHVSGGDVRGSNTVDTLRLIGGASGTANNIQVRGALHPSTPNIITFDTNSVERMRIDSSGNLLVGYTSSNGSYKLQVNSQIFATSATIATSDGRYKKDVTPLTGALQLVNALNPVCFNWKQHPVHAFDTRTPTVGFIAQEVQQALANQPYLNSIIKKNDCVIEPEEKDDDGNVIKEEVTEEFLGIAEGNMIALLTKAIQEQQAIITALTNRIKALESK